MSTTDDMILQVTTLKIYKALLKQTDESSNVVKYR